MTSSEIWMRQCAEEMKIRDVDTGSIGKVFSDMINEITLITGLKVPVKILDNGKEDAKPFARLISKFLLGQYGFLACAEVTLAFRLNAAGDLPGVTNGKETDRVDFFGAVLTIEHVGTVLFRYIRKRTALSAKIRAQLEAAEKPTPTPEEIDIEDRLFVNEYYRKYLSNEFTNVSLEYAYLVYDSLDKRGMIHLSNSDKNTYMKEAQGFRDRELSFPPVDREDRKDHNRLIENYLNDTIPLQELERVKRYAKRMVLMDMFKKWKAEKKLQIIEV